MKPHKHQWVKVGSTWKDGKIVKVKKRCRDPSCGAEKEIVENAKTK